MTAIQPLLTRTLLGACFLGLAARSQAQVSFLYDAAGNQLVQSNSAVVPLPTFQVFTPSYLGANSNGLLSVSVPVTGVGPFSYQWFLNGVAIQGATNNAFQITNATTLNLGKYQLVASNSAGAVASSVVDVSFFDPDGSRLPVAWELAYFDAIGVDPNADPDGDGVSNFQEYLDGTDPTNPNSVMPRLYISDSIFGGTVSVAPLKPKYQLGDIVQITAMPDPGGFFDGWLGSNAAPDLGTFTNDNANLTLVMNSTTWLTPQFLSPVVAWGYNGSGQTTVPEGLNNVVALAAGGSFSLALDNSGAVAAWGDDSYGQTNPPEGLSNVVAIAAGGDFGLALQVSGTVVGWGEDYYGQTAVPAGVSNVVAIAGGSYHSLVLQSNGTVIAWGYNANGQTNVPASLSNVVAIAAGDYFSLALEENGTVVAWGDNSYGQTNIPEDLSNVVAIAGGSGFSLALQANGTVVAWGNNVYGATNVPPGLSNVVAIAAGGSFSLALQRNGTVAAWGNDGNGATSVPLGLSNVVAIAAGTYHSLALINDGSPFTTRPPIALSAYSGTTILLSAGIAGAPPLGYQWKLNGTNLVGATNALLTVTDLQASNSGLYSVVASNSLATVSNVNGSLQVSTSAPIILDQPSQQIVQLGGNATFTAGVTGSLPMEYQWKFNLANIVGATQSTLNLTNVTIANLGNYRVELSNAFGTLLSSNAALTQALTLVTAWGDNTDGQTNVPLELGNVIAIAGGSASSLALESSGAVVAWGDNSYGETTVPAGLSSVAAIAEGTYLSLALQSNGTVVAWGYSGYGETTFPLGLSNVTAIASGNYFDLALQSNGTVIAWGNNVYDVTNVPAGLSNVVAIAAGAYHSMALQDNGTVVAWGYNGYGEATVPAGLSNVVAIAAGAYQSMALQDNGTVVAWGYNGYGEATAPAGLSNVVAIAAGNYFSLALQDNGTVVGWGDDSFGQTTVPANVSNVVAIAAGADHTIAVFNNGSPFITRPPISGNALSGTTVVLSAGVAGASPLSYQWKFNGTNLVGATNALLTLNDVPTTRSGMYTVVVSNSLGTASSAGTTLTVSNSAPIILNQPAGQTVQVGANADFTVTAAGSLPLAFQWQFNDANIGGATQATLDLTNVTVANVGSYRVKVSNAFGTTFSSNVPLTQALNLVVAWGNDSAGQTNVPLELANVMAIAGENDSSLALKSSGTLVAWGDNSSGETNVPAGLSNVASIAEGGYFGLALQSNGMVVGWGDDSYGETTIPANLSNVVAVAAGFYHSLALESNGTVMAWGYGGSGQTTVPVGLSNVVAIAAGGYFSLALQGDGKVTVWGDDTYGELNVPEGLSNVVAVAGGFYHCLALRSDGTVEGWGYNGYGQLNVPAGLSNVVAIATGDYFSLALQGNGTVVGWGENYYGETTIPSGLSNVVAIAAGAYHTIAVFNGGSPFIARQPIGGNAYSGATIVLSAGVVGAPPLSYQWKVNGTNLIGATNAQLTLTDVPTTSSGVYNLVVGNSFGTAISADTTLKVVNSAPLILNQPAGQPVLLGGNAAFAVTSTGSLPLAYQWQFDHVNIAGATQATLDLTNVTMANVGSYRVEISNAFGTTISSNAALTRALTLVVGWGDNTDGQTNVPPGLGTVVAIAAENDSSLALSANGTVVAWGDNSYGETNVPAGLSNVMAIAGGGYFSLALQSNGTVVAWGDNSFGESTIPTGLNGVAAVAAGFYHSLALESNGTVVAWGYNGSGQTAVPAGLSNVVAVAAGEYFSLALQGNGTVVAWGDDSYGEINMPAGLNNVMAIAGGLYHGLALESNATVVGWGDNSYGETTAPTSLSNAVAIAAGDYFSLALQGNATVLGWGDNSYGETTVPAGLSNVVAIAGGGYHSLALIHDGSPFIAQRTVSETAYSGSTVLLSVDTLGASPLSYQWMLNGAELVGATNVLLTLTNVQTTNSGVYSVVVSNSLGSASSGGTTLTVSNSAPIILIQPASQSVLLGGNAAFDVSTTGSAPLGYQWQFDRANITGATQATLDVTNITAANAGNYRVEVTNAFGTTFSSNATLAAALSLVVAWGDNSNGQTNVTPGLGTVMAIAGDGYASLALQANGTVAAWGDDSYGETTVPPSLSSVAAIAGGFYHNLALGSNGTVVAWGDDYDGETNVPSNLSSVAAVAAGFYHSLALLSNGTVVAWGDDYNGQTAVPPGLGNVAAIVAGGYFSLALQNNGTVVAWGDDSDGQTNVPTGLSNVVAIAAGDYFSLALQDNGTVVAWGDNSDGQTNVPTGLSNVVAIAAGGYFSLALQDNGAVVAWGNDSYDQTHVPSSLSNVVAIAAGGNHSIAIFNNGSPGITRQPFGGNAYSGATALLSIGVAGAPPLTYQWKFNGTNLIGATNALLTLVNAPTTRSGVYSVVVNNSLGTISSASTTLTVNDSAPVITEQPASQGVPLGGNAAFTVSAAGSLPFLGYQWQFNDASIAGATSETLDVTNATVAKMGNYRVAISNDFGTTFSSNATLALGPVNDMFANRIKITGISNTVSGSTEFATKEPGEPEHANNPGGSSVWWTWTAPTNGIVTVSTLGSSFDTLLAIYTGNSVANLTPVASDDDDGTLLTSLVTFIGTAGTAYQIVVDGFNTATGSVVLTVSQSPPAPPTIAVSPQNQTVDLGGSATFGVTAAGEGPFSYEWLKNGSVIGGATQAVFTIDNLQAGNVGTYSVIVSNAYGGVTNSATLHLGAGPPNDALANATKLAATPGIVTGSNVGATKEPGEPDHGGNTGGSSVWWAWTAPSNALVTLDTTGSAFETLLAIYTGNVVSNLTLIANDNGFGGSRTYFGSHVAFSAVAGTMYEIAVDGYDGANGNIVLNFQSPGTAPSNNLVVGSGKLLANGHFQLSVASGVPGRGYALLASTDLVHWAPALDFIFSNSPMVIHDPMVGHFKQRFYEIGPLSSGGGGTLGLAVQNPIRSNGVTLTFVGPPANYRIQGSIDLTHWITLTNVSVTNSPFQFSDPASLNLPKRFYRTVTP